MRRIRFFIIFALLSNICLSQNLVPNNKFEEYDQCTSAYSYPFTGAYYYGVDSWFSPSAGSPDYYNICAPTTFPSFSIPLNLTGYQMPKSGNAYSGFCVYLQDSLLPPCIEYCSVKLKNQLSTGKEYCAKYFVSLTDSSWYASGNIGMYFSDTSIFQFSGSNFPYIPQIENPISNIITDKVNWVEINGSFIASGGEQYINIGNFYPRNLTNVLLQPNGCANCLIFSQYYIDDVYVYDCDSIVSANAGNNLQICLKDSVIIGNGSHFSEYSYSWLPATGLNDPNIYNPKASPPITTTYYLTQTDFLGTITTDSVVITVINCDSNNVAEAGNSQEICKGNAIQIGMPTITGYTYQWQPPIGLSNANISNPFANPNVTTTYYLTSNYQGYYETIDSITITVRNCDTLIPKPNELIVSNAFTPNYDGVNDLFHANGNNIAQIQAKIFNRWGQELYKWDNLNEGWNGKYKGKEVSAGTYFYVITVVYNNGSVEEKKGAVELIR
jgi:gliding motility-associated-like protein